MEVRQARYFLAIADQQSMGKAAEVLHMTQPALSQAILQLERETKSQLFQRSSRGMRLTEHGLALLEPARQLVEASRDAVSALQLSTEHPTGSLVIAATPAFTFSPLSAWVAAFRKRFPAVSLHLVPFTGEEPIERVLDRHEADLVLAHYSLPLSDSITEVPMGREDLVLAVPANLDPFNEGVVNIRELQGRPLILSPKGSSLYAAIFEAFQKVGLEPTLGVESSFADTFLPLTAGGAGWSFVSRTQLEISGYKNIRVHSLEPSPSRPYSFYHQERSVSYAGRLFLQLAKTPEPDPLSRTP